MAEKTLKTRIINKHDTEENWNKATSFTPKAGEIIVYDPDSTHTQSRIKVGDGDTVVSSIPFFGTSTDNLVDLSSAQTISGDKTFTGSNTFTGTNAFSGSNTFKVGDIDTSNVSASTTIDGSGFVILPTTRSPGGECIKIGWGDTTHNEPMIIAKNSSMITRAFKFNSSASANSGVYSIATTSDLNNYVGLSSEQTISGKKTFTGGVQFGTGTVFNNGGIQIPAANAFSVMGMYDVSLPTKTGTLVTTADTMVGASGSTAGKAGLVPAPTTTDFAKFLRGDGTWAFENRTATGSGDTSDMIYLVGAKVQNSAGIDTYSHDTVYIDNSSRLTSIYKNTNVSLQNTIRLDPTNQYILVGTGSIGTEPAMYARYGQSSIAFSPNGGTSTYTYSFPTKGGTLAMTSDIPSTSNFASLSGVNEFTGSNTFTTNVIVKSSNSLVAQGSTALNHTNYSFGKIVHTPDATKGDYTLTLPAKSGTIALTSDIPSSGGVYRHEILADSLRFTLYTSESAQYTEINALPQFDMMGLYDMGSDPIGAVHMIHEAGADSITYTGMVITLAGDIESKLEETTSSSSCVDTVYSV